MNYTENLQIMDKTFTQKVAAIQAKLKSPKNRVNSFGKYSYRSTEDILESVKPILDGIVLNLSDEPFQMADRIYIKSTATLTDGENTISSVGYAREPDEKKGADQSQITGSASSYARKYALNGLLCIDDSEDVDAQEPAAPVKQKITDARFNKAIEAIKKGEYTVQQMNDGFDLTPNQQAILSGVE